MSVTAKKAVWSCSKAKGNARLVLLAFAEFANEQQISNGGPAEAFPSQETLATMCNCSRSTVEASIKALTASGELLDTGRRRKRGTLVYELPTAWLTEIRSGQAPMYGKVTDSRSDLTDSRSTTPKSGHLPDRNPVTNQNRNQKIEQEEEQNSSTDVSSSSVSSESVFSPLLTQQVGEQQVRAAREAALAAEREEREELLTYWLGRDGVDPKAGRMIEQLKEELSTEVAPAAMEPAPGLEVAAA